MEISYRLPRLTRSLRAFSELEAPGNPIPPDIAPFNYQKWKTKAYAESATWEDIQQYIEKDVGINKDIKKHLSDLRSFAVDLTGGDVDKCVIDEAAIFLLRLFLDERIVLQKHMQMLKERFGAVSHSMANKIFECVVSLASCLSEDCIYFIKAGAKKTNVDRELFGKHIQYTPPQVHLETPDLSVLTDLISIESETLKEFSMKYDNVTALTTKEDSVKPNTRKNGVKKIRCSITQ